MPDRFLTISDAEKFTGKSRSTLRRFIDSIVKADNSLDRSLLLPTIAEVLERELSEKNNQIAAMNERMRESNILMKDLHQRLALPAAKSSEGRQIIDERRTSSAENSKTSSASRDKSPVETQPRKSRFGWLFGE